MLMMTRTGTDNGAFQFPRCGGILLNDSIATWDYNMMAKQDLLCWALIDVVLPYLLLSQLTVISSRE